MAKKSRQTEANEQQKGSLSIHTENIFPIIKKWLYSEHDIFARELISNAIDATTKRKALQPDLPPETFVIEVKVDKDAGRIDFIDHGIGMTAEEVLKYINQIAFSGAEDFVEKFKDTQGNIIGHFGLGFYSSFMVADKVTIDTLSWQEGAEPAFWECDGSTEYMMAKGTRTDVGTTVSVYVNDENKQYLEDYKLREILERFCNFMPYSIELDKKVVNQKQALWNRKPTDVKEDEYKEFYKGLFHEYEDPLFWIHLNVDFPFNLRGILYFPKLKNDFDFHRGQVKLYCNNVFVADNLKEFIPEFLLLLRGGIDIPDIPLNVSRSFLQQDQMVKKITRYIIKKVADRFNEMFREDRKRFETLWEDIQVFLKFGIISDNEFYEAMKDIILFKTSSEDWVTIEEFKTRNMGKLPTDDTDKDSKEPRDVKVYYAAGDDTQVSYVKMMKDQGLEVIFSTSPLDTHLFQHLETRLPFTNFIRVDSEINDVLVDKDRAEIVDGNNQTELERVKTVFDQALGDKSITVEVKRLKSPEIPAMVVFNEHMRRFQEMHAFVNKKDFNLLANHNLVVNADNPVVKSILGMDALGKNDEAGLLCTYLHQLALLEQKRFDGKELQSFIENANKILKLVK